jgi:hypothetical protein
MSISKGAFGRSGKGGFIESRLGARGWGVTASLWVATSSNTTAARRGVLGLKDDLTQSWKWLCGGGIVAEGLNAAISTMQRDDENLYVPFSRNSNFDGNTGSNASVAVLKLSNGSLVRTMDTGGLASATAVKQDGTVAVVGSRNSLWPGSGGSSAAVWCYNDDGTLRWAFDPGVSVGSVVFDSSGNVIVGGQMNTTTQVHLWLLNVSTGAEISSTRVDADVTSSSVITGIDLKSSPMVVIRPVLSPGNDTFEVASNLSGVSSSSQKFNNYASPVQALDTSPFSFLGITSGRVVLQIESGSTIDSVSSGLQASTRGICRGTEANTHWVTSNVTFANNLAKITGSSLDTVENFRVFLDGNAIGLGAIVQNTHWNY